MNHVKIIQGDGVNEDSIAQILDVAMKAGYSATNIGFGCGGYLAQSMTRDTLRFAMKCSSITVNGKNRAVFKDPLTDHAKKSKAGRLDLVKCSNGNYQTVALSDNTNAHEFSVMRTVYENGELLIDDNLETIRNRTKFNLWNYLGWNLYEYIYS